MAELKPGLELGARYALVRQLGRGGLSEVWLADDRESTRQLALKILDARALALTGGLAALTAEVQHAASLPTGIAVRVHGLEQIDGWTVIAMDHLPGGDLGQFRGRSFASWAGVLDELCVALAAAHAQGLVHRDLKCANVLLDAEGHPRLTDFGLSALAGASVAPGGSPYNASPQQLRGETAQPADDLYALGALLYELIAGHPPYYPDISRERVLHEPLPPLQPRGAVPVRVRELALRLLAKAASQRPASVSAVRDALRQAAMGAGEFEHTAAPQITSTGSQSSATPARRWWPLAALAVVAAAVAVFIWLPDLVAERSTTLAQQARAEAEAEGQRRTEALAREASQAQARAEAEKARDEYLAAAESAEQRAAARWATELLAQAREHDSEAGQQYALANFSVAGKAWSDGLAVLQQLQAGQPAALAAALKNGASALNDGDIKAAREAYDLALVIDPGSPAAKAGRSRADKLEQAFAALDQALIEERAGRVAAAQEGYRRALALDAATPGAREALDRLASRQANDAYASAMAAGIAHLAGGRSDEARTAFQRAQAMRPDAGEPRDALAQLEQGQRASALRLLEDRARVAEADEKWAEASAAWREALALDAGIATGRAALERCESRAILASRIAALIEHPDRLWSEEVRRDGRGLVRAARAAAAPYERLRFSAQQLETMVVAAEVPVKLRLESDGLTEVVIYRVARFGRFASREIELLPGRYTVVGTRRGYRDVRREVEILPGASLPPLAVRCEEAI